MTTLTIVCFITKTNNGNLLKNLLLSIKVRFHFFLKKEQKRKQKLGKKKICRKTCDKLEDLTYLQLLLLFS